MGYLECLEQLLVGDDAYNYLLLFYKIESGNATIFTDEKTYFFVDSCDGNPAWLYMNPKYSIRDEESEFIKYIKECETIIDLNCDLYTSDVLKKKIGTDGGLKIKEVGRLNSYYYGVGNAEFGSSLMTYEIQTTAKYIDEVARLYRAARKEIKSIDISIDEAKAIVEQDISRGSIYLCYNEDTLVAMIRVAFCNGFARIGDVIVDKNYRSEGIGTFLVRGVANELMKLKYKTILYADVENDISNKLYQKCGFRKTGVIKELRIEKNDKGGVL